MGKRVVFILLVLALSLGGLPGIASCHKTPENISIPAYPVPRLNSFEAIGIARQTAVDYPAWAPDAEAAAFYASNNVHLTTLLWKAQYSGQGKWDVDLKMISRDGIDDVVYRWSVFEDTMKAVYVMHWLETRWEATSPLAPDDVMQIVQTSGLPYLESESAARPVGTWNAVMIDSSVWRVTGTVELMENGNTYQSRAQWKYDGNAVILESLVRI